MRELLTASGSLVFALGLLATMLFAGFVPVMVFFSMRHLKGIRRELERLNEHMQARAFAEAPPRKYTKMGTLDMS